MGMPRLQGTRRRDDGAALVELALVLPLFLVLIFGLIQYGWLFYQVQETSFAVREGARVSAVGTKSTADLTTHVTDKIPSASSAVAVTVCFTDEASPSGLSVGDEITVTATHNATDFSFPFVPFPSPLAISQDAQTRVETVVSGTSNYPLCAVTP